MTRRLTILASTLMTGLIVFWAGSVQGDVSKDDDKKREFDRRAAIRDVDRLVEAELKRVGVRSNPVVDDETFARRAWLEIAGRIPTVDELRDFLDSRRSDKRSDLIDELLASPGFSSRMYNYWADILRVKSRLQGGVSGEPYVDWLEKAVAENKPYDRFVHELLTAEGPAHAEGNGATGYYLRDRGMPQDNMANTLRVFLGTRLECAQCHDHPTDTWTQLEFFEMVAFTGGIQFRSTAFVGQDGRRLRRIGNEIRRDHGEEVFRRFRRQIIRPMTAGISGTGTGLTRLPNDYQYDNGEPDQIVTADALFGEEAELTVSVPRQPRRRRNPRRRGNNRRRQRNIRAPQVDSRAAFADWLTSPANPHFTTVIANRMWAKAMGRGLIDPIDDIKNDTTPSNPDLMRRLETLMVDVDYDLREFLRVLYNTKTWQRVAGAPENDNAIWHFQGPLLRRMTAAQVWDSLLTLVLSDVDATLAGAQASRAKAIYARYEALRDLSDEEIVEAVVSNNVRRAGVRQLAEERRAFRKKVQPLVRKLRQARRRRDPKAEKRIIAELKQLGVTDPKRPFARGRNQRGRRGLVRASKVGAPAPADHLLRAFGQSDREQIQADHTDANVPQVLALMNGFVEENVLDESSALSRMLSATDSSVERIRLAYLAILGRRPHRAESSMWKQDVRRQGDAAWDDLVWTLVNSNEFRFVQ